MFAIPALIPSLLGGLWRLFLAPLVNPATWPGLALAVAVAFGWGWWKGDAHGDRQCEVRIARDKADQDRKIREAGEETTKAIDKWKAETERTNELEIELAIEASKDPIATRSCFGLDGMRRLNRITGQPKR